MAPDAVHLVRSSICASRSHVRRTAADIRVAAQADMAATAQHRQVTVDRTEHQATVAHAELLVPAEGVATVAEAVMLRVVADTRPVEVVDILAAVDTPVVVAIPAVIARTKRRCKQRLA